MDFCKVLFYFVEFLVVEIILRYSLSKKLLEFYKLGIIRKMYRRVYDKWFRYFMVFLV